MLYSLLKIPAAIGLWMYCRQLRVNNKATLNLSGPLLIACNHPNSFLDAIILSSVFKKPIYSLARGDVFKHSLAARLLRSLKMFPVFRNSEGAENMGHNYSTFDACKEIFKKNGIVLIFSEGRCINEWHLRPLMKGTARLALSSWEVGIPLTVLPTGINYQSFTQFGKNIQLNFGNMIHKEYIDTSNGFGKSILEFNQLLTQELKPLVYEIEKSNQKKVEEMGVVIPAFIKLLLLIPAIAGWLLHLPLWLPIKFIAKKYCAHNDHYDSVVVGLLFVLYPVFIIVLLLLTVFLCSWWLAFALVGCLPLLAWCYMYIKPQF
ncbi:MAG: 1-acyl-sn-glycerol-3-phosphate acyltransferase [Ferruginibacter sp.]